MASSDRTGGNITPGMIAEQFSRILRKEADPDQSMKPSDGYARMLPTVFTFCCFLMFASPLSLTLSLAYDTTVGYWIGRQSLWAWIFPVVFIVGHIVHVQKGFPKKPVVLLCTLLPGIAFLVLGDIHLSVAYDLSDQLFSTDCDTFESKRQLDRAWQKAYTLYTGCLNRTVASGGVKHNFTMTSALELYRIHHCEEYEDALQEQKAEWTYLRHLEENHHCSGWCESGQRLWTYKDVRDPCSEAVATVLRFKVQRVALQIVVYAIFVIALTAIVLVVVGPKIRQAGFNW